MTRSNMPVSVPRAMLLAATSLVAMLASAPVAAQETPGPAAGPVMDQPVPDAPAADAAATGDEIVVLGVRGAQRKAVDLKRLAPQIVDSIVAEDIGKLPDATIADSLQRVPGIQIGRSAGEGASVNVRGLGQVLVTINGEQFLGGQNIDGAQPNFTDIPPTLFSGVDVFKSPTARQLEGGVSGTIDLKTRRPFDLKQGVSATASAEGSYGSRVKKLNQLYSGLLGWRNDRFGVLVAGSYSKADLANIGIDTGNSWLVSTDVLSGRDLRGDGDITNSTRFADKDYVYQPAVVSNSNRKTSRERYGLNAAAQAKLSDALTLTGEVAYTRLEERNRAVNLQLNSGYAARPLLNGSVVDDNGVVTVGNFRLPGFAVNSAAQNNISEAYNTNLELAYDDDGRFKGSLRWVHGDASRDSVSSQADSKPVTGSLIRRGTPAACRATPAPASCSTFANAAGFPTVDIGIDYTTTHPTLAFGTDVTNPANYVLQSTWGFGDKRRARTDAFRADGSYDFDGFLKSVDFGARYNTRKVSVEEYKYLAPVTVDGLGLLGGPGDLYFFKDPQIGHTGRPEIEGLSVLPIYTFPALGGQVRNYSDFVFGGVPAAGIPALDPNAMADPLAFQNSLFPGNAPYVDPTRSFRVKEKNSTLYGQANFGDDTGMLGVDFSGNIGLRYIRTERTVFANRTDPAQFIGTGGNYNGVFLNLGTVETKKIFNRFLPSANLTFDLALNQKLRFAAAKVVGSLNLFDLGAGQVLYYGANNGRYPNEPDTLQVFLQGNSGNPNLEPYQSTNYNASYEYYFGQGGLLSAAVFLFDVKSFPQAINDILPVADQDGVIRAGGVVSSTGNGSGGKIKGLELGYQQQFDFLPGFLSGFGVNANFTLSDSSSSNTDLFGKQLPVPDNSRYQYNLVGFYQKGPIQARVAYNWRSKRFAGLQSVNGVSDGDVLAIYSRPVGYLDGSASYDVTPNITVFAQGTNLTNAYDQQYAQFKNLFYQQNLYERRLTLGVRIRN